MPAVALSRVVESQCHGLQVDQRSWPAFRAGVSVRAGGCGALRVWAWPGCRSRAGGRFHVRLFRAGNQGGRRSGRNWRADADLGGRGSGGDAASGGGEWLAGKRCRVRHPGI